MNSNKKKYNWHFILKRFISYIILILGAILFIIPFLWMVSTSLKTNAQAFAYPPQWIPRPIMWQNYIEAWFVAAPFFLYFKNTAIITTGALIGTILSSSLVAFSFARLKWTGRDFFFIIVLSTMMLPYQVTIIPLFILFRKLDWINTFKPLIVPSFFGPAFYIFLLRQFFRGIPKELDDAAKLDGCSSLGIYWRIILPLSKPALAAVAIFSFMFNWNSLIMPLIYLSDPDKYTLSLGLTVFRQRAEVIWTFLMADSVLVMLPCIIVFFFGQKLFVKGIALSGIKG